MRDTEKGSNNTLSDGGKLRRRRRRRVRKEGNTPSSGVAVQQEPRLKRRRRSRQRPVKDPKSSRKLLFFFVSIAIIGVFLLALVYSYTIAYHNSNTFKVSLERACSGKTGADVSINHLNVRANHCDARSAYWTWKDDASFVQSLELNKLTSEQFPGSLLSFNWSPSEVSAATGQLHLNLDSPDKLNLRSMLGRSVDALNCSRLNVYDVGESKPFIEGVSVKLQATAVSPKISFSEGMINLNLLKEFNIYQGFIRVTDGALKLSTRFKLLNGNGAIALKGDITNSEVIEFDISLEQIPSRLVLGENLGNDRVVGLLSGKGGELSYSDSENYQISISTKSDRLQLKGFPCFTVLSEILRKMAYKQPIFTTSASLRVLKSDGGYALEDIHLAESGFLRVRGNLKFSKQGACEGQIKIGVPTSSRERLDSNFVHGTFVRESGGYLWQTVEVSSENGELTDNLRSMLISSKRVKKSLPMDADSIFDRLLSE